MKHLIDIKSISKEEIENIISALISLLEKGTGNPAGSLNFLKSQTP